MRYFHLPKTHFVIPSFFHIRVKPNFLNYEIKFNDSCKYDLNGLDQQDWNKLNGLTNAIFGNATKSQTLMVVWRYNIELQKFQVGIYIHNYPKQERILPEENKSVVTLDGELCKIKINLMHGLGTININGTLIHIDCDIRFNTFVRETNPWFGGNNSAPKFIHYYSDFTAI